MIKFFGKSIKDFDSFERVVWDRWFRYEKDLSIQEKVKLLEENEMYRHVHYKDKWELMVYTSMQLDQYEYSGSLIVVSYNMHSKFNAAVRRMCCGIFTGTYKCVSGRRYHIGFDYGH